MDSVRVSPTSGRSIAHGADDAAPPTDPLRVHGDAALAPGLADHAVNVIAGGPPAWLRPVLRAAAVDLAAPYPDPGRAEEAIARHHGRDRREVLATNGAAEALWLLPSALRPRHAACVHPGFTESEAALRAHGVPVTRVLRDPAAGFALDPDRVPADADLVIVGHPASPSGTLDPPEAIDALRRPGRVVVVDEAYMSMIPGEPGSFAPRALGDVLVVRSLTKLLTLAGLRVGYVLGPADLLDRLRALRPPWSANAVALAATDAALRRPGDLAALARRASGEGADLQARLLALPAIETWPTATNFTLVHAPDGPGLVARLRERGFAVRHAASFPGLDDGHVRITARTPAENAALVAALA